MLLVDRYAPSKLADIIGNEEAKAKIQTWILNWLSGHKRRPLLIYGPSGVGKTSVAYVLAKEYNLEVVSLDASQVRTKDRVGYITAGARLGTTLFGNQRIMLVDDADSFFGNSDRGGMGEILKVIEENPCPIILTAHELWDKKLATVRSECENIELKKINKSALFVHIKKIRDKEYPHIADDFLNAIITNAHGDVRAALNDLQSHSTVTRDVDADIFERVRGIFKAETAREAKDATGLDVDYETLRWWIEENIAREYDDLQDVARGFDMLSRSDIFMGRISMSYWMYLKYAIDLQTVGVSAVKKVPYRKFTKYQFPSYLRQMAQTVDRRAKRKSIGLKIGKITHTNRRDALELVTVLADMGQVHAQEFMDFYRFEEEELAFIFGTSVDRIGIKKQSAQAREEPKPAGAPDAPKRSPPSKKGQTTLF